MNANPTRTLTRALALAAALALPAAASAQVDTGSANFSRYVALGDSLTAGFEAGSLHQNAQSNSYPALIHRQATGGGGFQQPIISEPGIPGKLVLRTITASGIPVITPESSTGQPINLGAPAYQNLAIPGADAHDILASRADAGVLYQIILRDPRFTALQLALAQNPTFVSLWIGNNDVLGAATSGIVVEGVTLTPVAQFEADFRAISAAIAASGARMAMANIPDVTTIPFVTTVSRFVTLPNGVVFNLIGPEGPIGPNDFVLLSAAAAIQQGRGIPTQVGGAGPLGNEHVLSAAEVATIRARVAAFNAIIRAEASARGAAFVDANAQLAEIAARGRNVGGIVLTPAFLTGGIFSYDGVHPTPIGYGVVANAFIEAINAQFDAEIPPVNLAALMFGPGALGSTVAGSGKAGRFEGLLPFYFSPQAMTNLRWALGIPQTAELEQKPPRRRGGRRGRG